MNQQTKATLFGLAAVMAWSTVASAFKLSLKYLDPVQLLFFANLTSVLILGTILGLNRKLTLVFKYDRRQLFRTLLLGLLSPLFYYLVLFKAYDLLPAQEAQSLNYTWAITMTLLSVPLLGQKIGAKDIIAGIVCYAGVFVISTRGQPWNFPLQIPWAQAWLCSVQLSGLCTGYTIPGINQIQWSIYLCVLSWAYLLQPLLSWRFHRFMSSITKA